MLASLIAAAETVALNLIGFYDGYRIGGTTGMFEAPVYWWEAGACWNVSKIETAANEFSSDRVSLGIPWILVLHGQHIIQQRHQRLVTLAGRFWQRLSACQLLHLRRQ